MEELDPGAGRAKARRFRTTHWSLVTAARGGSTPEARAALSELCQRYWYPLYAYVRRRGYPAVDAEDLTQSFFAVMIEKNRLTAADPARGRFRTFLLSSMNHFVANERDRAEARKRRPEGGWAPLDVSDAERRLANEPVDGADPGRLYLKDWAITVLNRAMVQAQSEYERRGRGEAFRRLKALATAESDEDGYRSAARDLGISEELARLTTSRIRRRLQTLVTEEVSATVAEPRDARLEMHFLLNVLRS